MGWVCEGLWVFCSPTRVQPPWVVGRPLRLPHQGWHAASGALALQGVRGGLGARRSLGVLLPDPDSTPLGCRATASVASSGVARGKRGACPTGVRGGLGARRSLGVPSSSADPAILGCRATASVASVRGGAWQAGRLPYRVSGVGWVYEGLWGLISRPRIQPPWVVGRPLRLSQSGVARGKRGACPTGCPGWVGCAKVFGCSVPDPEFNQPGLLKLDEVVEKARPSDASASACQGTGACSPPSSATPSTPFLEFLRKTTINDYFTYSTHFEDHTPKTGIYHVHLLGHRWMTQALGGVQQIASSPGPDHCRFPPGGSAGGSGDHPHLGQVETIHSPTLLQPYSTPPLFSTHPPQIQHHTPNTRQIDDFRKTFKKGVDGVATQRRPPPPQV